MGIRVLLTGSKGQLGRELISMTPDRIELKSTDSGDLDICDSAACLNEIDSFKPAWIINAAAYTDVEQAENDFAAALRVNKDGVENLARAARGRSVGMVHISTDFVFSGDSPEEHSEDDATFPLNKYGESKLAGEEALKNNLYQRAIIIRTSWLYSAYGKNFVKTVLRLLREKPFLTIINDQIGVPTSTRSLANVIFRAISSELDGTFHWCDAGKCSWYEFACEIQSQALELGLISIEKEIKPITTQEFPSKVLRPAYSVLNQSKLANAVKVDPLPWQSELKMVLKKIYDQESAA